jgi:hypothetical protein
VSPLAAQLDTLRTAGAEAFDGPGLRFIARLLRRAEHLTAGRERLHARAQLHLTQFNQRFEAARAAAQHALEALQAEGADPQNKLAAHWARGAFSEITRQAPALLRRARTKRPAQNQRRLDRLTQEARARGLSPTAQTANQLAQALFRDTAQQALTTAAVARAADHVPAIHGAYNPHALVAETLQRLAQLSPIYLRTALQGFEDLAALNTLPAPPKAKKRR